MNDISNFDSDCEDSEGGSVNIDSDMLFYICATLMYKMDAALERKELGQDLVHVAIEWVVVMLVLLHIHAAPRVIFYRDRQLNPAKLLRPDVGSSAVLQSEVEVGGREGGVAISGDQVGIKKTAAAFDNIGHWVIMDAKQRFSSVSEKNFT
jgi:hypothetical protein